MSFAKNDQLRNALRRRAAELEKTLTVGDPTIPQALVTEFAAYFEGRSFQSAYQMVCYSLRDKPLGNRIRDRRKTYTDKELDQLVLLSHKERKAYAEETGRSLRAVDAAMQRHKAKSDSNAATPIAIQFAVENINKRGFFSFSSATELKAMDSSRAAVLRARDALRERAGLTLRSPNILYHPITRRRYFMTSAEQVSLLGSPLKYLKARADHIKEHWVISDVDPISDEPVDISPGSDKKAVYSSRTSGYPVMENGAIDVTGRKGGHVESVAQKLLISLKTFDFLEDGTNLVILLDKLFVRVEELKRSAPKSTGYTYGVKSFSPEEEQKPVPDQDSQEEPEIPLTRRTPMD